eukprot:CAMPEP_0202964890 /NCGR_PEP_ID=MMETSP1396-20130829/9014_1 /ASSEMBLY_ACC=CAM_ASM_000872 /TAXON_ID= /ORGANISM="Pseudokeronopsis sp., Strain Brazil" /LENGTH=86 /DNA_ID=CAMNT_0049687377 /DNA_START=252 /DNA_END=508 /DNA_ORIENTATION=-
MIFVGTQDNLFSPGSALPLQKSFIYDTIQSHGFKNFTLITHGGKHDMPKELTREDLNAVHEFILNQLKAKAERCGKNPQLIKYDVT